METEFDDIRINRKMRRRVTDSTGKIVFFTFAALWLGLLGWSITVEKNDSDLIITLWEYTSKILDTLKDYWFPIIAELMGGFLLAVGFIYVIKSCTNILYKVATAMVYIATTATMISLIVNLAAFDSKSAHASLLSSLFILVTGVTLMIGLGKIDRNTVQKIVKDACSAVFFYPRSLLITIGTFGVLIVMMGLFFYISLKLTYWYEESPEASRIWIAILLFVFNLLTFSWMAAAFSSIMNLYASTASILWCSTVKENTVSSSDIHRQVHSIVRSHSGTVFFGSSLAAPYVKLATIYHSESVTWNKIRQNPVIAVCILVYYFIQGDGPIYTMMIIYGTDYVTSARKILHLMAKNPWNFYVWKAMADGVVVVGISFPMMIIAIFYFVTSAPLLAINIDKMTSEEIILLTTIIAVGLLLAYLGVIIARAVIDSFVNSVHICAILDDCQEENKNDNLKALMHNP